jgi:hypothetical protein
VILHGPEAETETVGRLVFVHPLTTPAIVDEVLDTLV